MVKGALEMGAIGGGGACMVDSFMPEKADGTQAIDVVPGIDGGGALFVGTVSIGMGLGSRAAGLSAFSLIGFGTCLILMDLFRRTQEIVNI